MIGEFLTATFQYTMRWKIFQLVKFLFRHSSNSRKLSRQKFYNELACVAHDASKKCRLKSTTTNGWRHFGQLEQRKSSELFPIQSEKSPDSGFFTCDPTKKCVMPSSRERHKGIIGRGHDLRLGNREQRFAARGLGLRPTAYESFKPIASCRKCKTNYFSTLK